MRSAPGPSHHAPIEPSSQRWEHRSPLALEQAARRLAGIAPASPRPTSYRDAFGLELAAADDPFAPAIAVRVERRRVGSFVTAELVPSALLRDFGRVVHGFFTAAALFIFAFFATQLQGLELVRAGSAVGAVWSSLMWMFAMAHHAMGVHAARALDLRRFERALRQAVS